MLNTLRAEENVRQIANDIFMTCVSGWKKYFVFWLKFRGLFWRVEWPQFIIFRQLIETWWPNYSSMKWVINVLSNGLSPSIKGQAITSTY